MSMMKCLLASVRLFQTPETIRRPVDVSGDIKKIKDHLEAGNRLSSAEAFTRFGTLKLTSRISDLRKRGMLIKDAWQKNERTGKRYKEYWI